MKEIPLKGGRSTNGIVRVGDTLRRPHKQESEFANSVLKYLEKQGYPYSQRYLVLTNAGGILSHSLKENMFRVNSETQLSRNYANL